MTRTDRQSSTAGRRPFHFARRIGLALGGAVVGMVAALHAIDAGLAFLRNPEFLAVFTLVGGVAAYLGADVEPPARPRDSAAALSAVGTLLAGSAALAGAWLLILQMPATGVWAMVLTVGWLFGVTAQVSAGLLVSRFRTSLHSAAGSERISES
jgi:hypothetical protein